MPSDAGATAAEDTVNATQADGVAVPARVLPLMAQTDRFSLERVLSSFRLVASIAAFALLVAVFGAGIRDGLEIAVYESGAANAGFDSVLFNVDFLAREPVIVRYDDDFRFKEMTRYGLQGWVPSICFFPVCLAAL